MKPTSTIILVLLHTFLLGQESVNDPITIGQQLKIYSEILQEERTLQVYLPPSIYGMDGDRGNLPVIYVLDGESQWRQVISTVDYLSAATSGADEVPRSIVVGIPNTNRNRDLSPIKGMLGNDKSTLEITGGGPAFLQFITSEVMPFIDSTYSSCDHHTLVGHSLGGLLCFEALLRHKEYFTNYVIIDPGLGFADGRYMDEVLDSLDHVDYSDEHVYIAAANTRPTFLNLEQLASDTSDIMMLIDKPVQRFINSIDTSDWQAQLTYKYYADENHFTVPHRATYDALRSFYDYYSFETMMNYYHPTYIDSLDLLPQLVSHYSMISTRLGCRHKPMMGYINSFAWGMEASGRHDLAEQLLRYNIEQHPGNATVYNNLGYYMMSRGETDRAIEAFSKSLTIKEDSNIQALVDELKQ